MSHIYTGTRNLHNVAWPVCKLASDTFRMQIGADCALDANIVICAKVMFVALVMNNDANWNIGAVRS